MVKHQRRSHQRGVHSSELDDCTSDSESGESPSTPKMAGMEWPQHNGMHSQGLHRASSYTDFSQHIHGGYQPYGNRTHTSQGPHEYHRSVVHEQPHMLHRTTSMLLTRTMSLTTATLVLLL